MKAKSRTTLLRILALGRPVHDRMDRQKNDNEDDDDRGRIEHAFDGRRLTPRGSIALIFRSGLSGRTQRPLERRWLAPLARIRTSLTVWAGLCGAMGARQGAGRLAQPLQFMLARFLWVMARSLLRVPRAVAAASTASHSRIDARKRSQGSSAGLAVTMELYAYWNRLRAGAARRNATMSTPAQFAACWPRRSCSISTIAAGFRFASPDREPMLFS